jgi:hypothetical protein
MRTRFASTNSVLLANGVRVKYSVRHGRQERPDLPRRTAPDPGQRAREELDQLVVDRVSAQMPAPVADPEHWEEQIKQFTRDALDVYRAHPGSARATLGLIPAMEGSLRAAETLVSLCLAGGVPRQAAAWFCDLFALYVGAVAVEESIWVDRARDAGAEGPDHAALDEQLGDYFSSLPPDKFPMLSALAREMVTGDGEDRFEFALDILIGGLKAYSARG